jgi:hypothetical protein
MNDVAQHILVLALVLACALFVARGVWRTIAQKRGGIGKCCEKGCQTDPISPQASKSAKVVFMPVENLVKNRKGT